MNTFWLKIALLAVVIVALIVLVSVYWPAESKPKPKPKTFYDIIEEDDRRLRAEPQPPEPSEMKQPTPSPSEEQPVAKEPAEPPEFVFKELSEIEEIEAERLFEYALQQRKIGRLPGPGYKPMVDACRQIMEKFPGSEFDYKARRMLADIPEKYRQRYNITKEEIDLTRFLKH
jgi:type IV secretory pathway VirB10-like protein